MKVGICDVHSLAKGDNRKRLVSYCKVCDSWICESCRPDTLLRARAMIIKAKNKLTGK